MIFKIRLELKDSQRVGDKWRVTKDGKELLALVNVVTWDTKTVAEALASFKPEECEKIEIEQINEKTGMRFKVGL